jgi:hypothetical protein
MGRPRLIEDGTQTSIRMPTRLHQKLVEAARWNNVPLGVEIRQRLEATFRDAATQAEIVRLRQQLSELEQ